MISIVIPVYNVEAYFEECLQALYVQVYGDFEVVMVDDGSTDGSGEICRKWTERDKRFRLISKSNGGLSSARNAGIEASNGDYITFVDSDDAVHPHYLSILMEMASRSEYAIVGVGMTRFTDEMPLIDCKIEKLFHYLPEDALKEMLYQNGMLINSACGKLFSRELIGDIRFREGIMYEDLEWMTRVLEGMPKSKRVGICDAPLYFYRKREGSLIETFSLNRFDVLDVTREIEDRAQEVAKKSRVYRNAKGVLRAARDRRLSANFDIFMQLSKPGREEYATQRQECWREIKRLRIGSLFNPHVRRKNRLGILLSFLGPRICGAVGARFLDLLKA